MDNLATSASAWLRTVRRAYLTAKARLTGKAFRCAALAGDSQMNVCVNADLTVSCNCHDVDGSGLIGDLNRESLADCFSGPVAAGYRLQLAEGRLPIPNCARRCDLRMVSQDEARRRADEFHLPRFIMVENTVACNLRCTSCPRTTIRQLRRKASMSLEDVTRVAHELKTAGIKTVAYLNLGEPFLSKKLRRELEIIRQLNPGIRIYTSTNGVVVDSDEKREAALMFDEVQFSVDGITQEMVARYQRGSDFEKAFRNMKALVDYRDAGGLGRPKITWKYLLFRWNDRREHVKKAIEMASRAKVDRILFERTVSPFYGIPWRSYLGFHHDVGENVMGGRLVVLRQ